LLALMGLLLGVLALPLGGAGGHSHAPGSAPAGALRASGVYVVQPGDTLWSIAQRVDPSGDPRPLVDRLAAQVGTDDVVPGERVTLP
jgi:LysM repeat protein